MEKTVYLENKKNKDNQFDKEMANLVWEDYGSPDECFYDIDPGVYDYLVKWVGWVAVNASSSVSNNSSRSPYSYINRYFHINTARKYEIIGSSQAEEDGCTVWIENAKLEPVHAEIRLKEAYNYYITQKAEIKSDEFDETVQAGVYIR